MEIDKCEQIAEKIIRYNKYLKDVSKNNTLSISSVRDIVKEDADLIVYFGSVEPLKNKLLEEIAKMKGEFKVSCGESVTNKQFEEFINELCNMDEFVDVKMSIKDMLVWKEKDGIFYQEIVPNCEVIEYKCKN